MNILGTNKHLSGKHAMLLFAALLLAYPALRADNKPAKPAAPAAKPAAPAPKPAGGGAAHGGAPGGAGASHGPSTSSPHGPTTSSPKGPTTSSPHGPTTSSPKGPTTSSPKGPGASSSKTPGPSTSKGPGPAAGKGPGPAAGKGPGPAAGKGPGPAAGKGPGPATAKGPGGSKIPNNQKTVTAKNGATATVRKDGKVATLKDPKRGMEVHHSLSGNRRVVTERADHSRIVAERGGRGYVQRPFRYHNREFARRSYYYGGRYHNAYYGRYYYGGVYLNPYYPSYYYGPYYYGWVASPWVTPVPYAWGWGGNPWYGYYGAYFTPYPSYAGPAFWLTDYLIATSLSAAYEAQAQQAALNNPAPLTPEVKQLISDEVRQQVTLEYNESKAAEPDDKISSIQLLLTDGKQHVFVAAHDLDVVDANGGECALSQGDAIQLRSGPSGDDQPATLAVLAAKGGSECPNGDLVSVALPDLQEMQNHMRETIDQGMQELQKKQGKGGLPAAPSSAKDPPKESAMALAAPPPPPEDEVKAEIKQESQAADQEEKDAGVAPVELHDGMTIAEVEAAMGAPQKHVDVGPKKIYVYKDMKVTFRDGKVSDIQ